MPIDDRGRLEAALQVAAAHWHQGHLQMALIDYREILLARLTSRRASDLHAVGLMVMERLADLAVLFGNIAADTPLDGMAGLCRTGGNVSLFDGGSP